MQKQNSWPTEFSLAEAVQYFLARDPDFVANDLGEYEDGDGRFWLNQKSGELIRAL